MSITTNIQWCDSTLNFIMGCLGCELYPTPEKILAAIDRACLLADITGWTKGTAKSLFGEILAQVWATLEESETGPGEWHLNGLTTTNLRHLRKRMKRRAAEQFSTKAGRLIQATIEKSLKCYAAQLHANRGFDLENPERDVNVGYAPTFETITRFPGRTEVSAHWSDLTGIERDEKPWLNGLPRLIFVSDMGDAFSRKQDFEFLRSEMAAFQTPEGQRHLWLWLTKRPDVMRQFVDNIGGFPANVCAMTTVTSAKTLSRVDALREVNAAVRGLSLEPLWEPLADKIDLTGIDWVIVGGESGAKANVELFPVEWASRLARARGTLGELQKQLTKTRQGCLLREAKRLSHLCRLSAQRLDKCLRYRVASAAAVPRYLGKETIMQTLRSKAVKGKVIGKGRAALRLTVKNLWDFEEMMRRGLEPTAQELQVTRNEIERIRGIASQIECS